MTMDDVDNRSKARFQKSTARIGWALLISLGVNVGSYAIIQYDTNVIKSAAGASCSDVRYLARALSSDFTSRADFESRGHPAPITLKQAKGWRGTAASLLAHSWTTCPVPVVTVPRTRISIPPKGSSP